VRLTRFYEVKQPSASRASIARCERVPDEAFSWLNLEGILYKTTDQEDRWVESEIPEHRTADKAPKLNWAPRQIYSSRKHWIDP
jgi:hypothetical protein